MTILRDVHKTVFIIKVQKKIQGWQQTQTLICLELVYYLCTKYNVRMVIVKGVNFCLV